MIIVTDDNWNIYLKKYKNLMWRISHMISGDPTISNLEDNYADLMLAAIESIKGFHKKTGMSFEEMMTTKYFDQYTKTCLWTAKARKGNGIKKNYPVTNRKLSIEVLQDQDPDNLSGAIFVGGLEDRESLNPQLATEFSELFDCFSNEDAALLKVISDNPDVFSSTGRLKLNTLSKKSKLPIRKLNKIINKLRKKVNYDIES